MTPLATTPGRKAPAPAELPEPSERHQAELAGRPEEPLLPKAHRQAGRLLLILILFIALLVVLFLR